MLRYLTLNIGLSLSFIIIDSFYRMLFYNAYYGTLIIGRYYNYNPYYKTLIIGRYYRMFIMGCL